MLEVLGRWHTFAGMQRMHTCRGLRTALMTVQVVDMAATEMAPEGWADHERPARLAAPTDASIYELHVRDFSVSDATVPERLRGKYLAFAEADTAGARLSLG